MKRISCIRYQPLWCCSPNGWPPEHYRSKWPPTLQHWHHLGLLVCSWPGATFWASVFGARNCTKFFFERIWFYMDLMISSCFKIWEGGCPVGVICDLWGMAPVYWSLSILGNTLVLLFFTRREPSAHIEREMGCVGGKGKAGLTKQLELPCSKPANIQMRRDHKSILVNHLRLFDTFFVFPEMMLLRAWERMCNGFSVGYQTLKLYGPALVTGSCYPDFDWIFTTVELWAWSLPRVGIVGIVGMSDGLDEGWSLSMPGYRALS